MSDTQKFFMGDHVKIAKDLGISMSHFENDCEAIVIGSCKDIVCGSTDELSYSLYIKDFGECSWYEENQLTLIEENRLDILKSWKKHRKNAKKDY